MAVIFFFSAQPADTSNELSLGVTEAIVKVVAPILHIDKGAGGVEVFVGSLNGPVRSFAHAAVYLILALLVMNALRLRGIKAFLLTMAFCAIYAGSDEVHQYFVPGRACELVDFLVDCSGALTGSLLFFLNSVYRRNVGTKKATNG